MEKRSVGILLVERLFGATVADETARYIEYRRERLPVLESNPAAAH